jgi:hypothetical protein
MTTNFTSSVRKLISFYKNMKVIFLVFLTSQLGGSEWTAARLGQLAAGYRTP